MKLIDIALKDLYRSFRNAMFMVFGLALPLLTAALFFFAFGGLGSEESGFQLPTVQVQVVNLDEGQAGFSAGALVADVLQDAMPDIIHTVPAADAQAARDAVDRQQAAVAVIIPTGFTAAVFAPEGSAAVELYQDPTLVLGPSIVKAIVSQLIDGFAGNKIATAAAQAQLSAAGAEVDAATLQQIAIQYAGWATALGEGQQANQSPFFEIRFPAGSEKGRTNSMASILGMIMAGMMVFYVFFTGAATAQSILQEEEAGTLPRLFATPTAHTTILGGKFAATFLLLAVQVVVLVVVSALVFAINWGPPLAVALVIAGLVVVAASFGIFVTSWLKDTRQAGIVFGGVMTVMGMIGMIGVFTLSVPDASKTLSKAPLIVPQGWAVYSWQLLLEGGGVADVLLPVAVMLAAGVAFFAIGAYRFSKRFT